MNNFLPGLYIVSTPIGNLEDITLRALNVLKNSDQILCEDTRRSLKLLNYYDIKKKLISNHKFNEKKILGSIIKLIKNGKMISIISDAGTPTLSDPGLILIRACIKEKIKTFSMRFETDVQMEKFNEDSLKKSRIVKSLSLKKQG